MTIKIEEILMYGRFYADIKDHVEWWLCLADYKIYDTEKIIEMFSWENRESILTSGTFIPLFKTDILALEKTFLKTLSKEKQKDIVFKDSSCFDRDFKTFIEQNFLIREWYIFERNHLRKNAITWCIENGLPYS